MKKSFDYVSLANLYHLSEGLTLNVNKCAAVLEHALVHFNEKTRIPDQIYSWNKSDPATRLPLSFPNYGRIIVDVTQSREKNGQMLYFAQILEKKDEKENAPLLMFSMHSPSLNIPMRVEVPLRSVIKGGHHLKGTYSVYLHALICDDKTDFVYYGITKRGWNKRFTEHTRYAFKDESCRLFPMKLRELCDGRLACLSGESKTGPKLAGIISAICAVGLNEQAAMDAEEYLVDKYSLSSKHLNGLNMLPGGEEGIRSLHKLSLRSVGLVETEDREAVLDTYLKLHPQFGKPKPGIAEKWNDPAYAEAVICAHENRLNADQVREIRYLAAMGSSVEQIKLRTGALDDGQVQRVLTGRTYSRIH